MTSCFCVPLFFLYYFGVGHQNIHWIELNSPFTTKETKVKTVKKSCRRLDWALLGESKNRNWAHPQLQSDDLPIREYSSPGNLIFFDSKQCCSTKIIT